MRNQRLRKNLTATCLSATMVLAGSSFAFGAAQALPNGMIVNVGGVNYLTDSQGERYSGWFMNWDENWYYFNKSDKTMKTGWHHDDEDGYWYYLNPSDGRMVVGWQNIDGKEYFFQPVRNRGNYYFSSEQEKWLYSLNSNVPYGAMYTATTTPDGSMVDGTGAKITESSAEAVVQNGWVSQDGKWYYYENGIMVSGSWKTIDGKSYYFGNDGAMFVNIVTPDGRYVGNDGAEVINTIGVVTAEQQSAIESILAREMERVCFVTDVYETNVRQVDNEIWNSTFTKQHVREAAWDYLYFSYYNRNLITPENPAIPAEPYFNINSFYDKDKVNELIENIYGVNPEFKSGEEIYFTGWDEPHLEVSGDRITSQHHGMGNVDGVVTGYVEDLAFSFDGMRLNVTGRFSMDNKYDSIVKGLSFHAVFKVNPNNRFPYQLSFVRMDELI